MVCVDVLKEARKQGEAGESEAGRPLRLYEGVKKGKEKVGEVW